MSDRDLDLRLQRLHEGLLLMAGRVEEMIAMSVKALCERDADLARATIQSDGTVNRAELDNDELCLQILSGSGIGASDLRFITLALKMVTDLERIGDLAVNICERVADLRTQAVLPHSDEIVRLGELVGMMVRDAIEAFVDREGRKAELVFEKDDEVDELYAKIFREMVARMSEGATSIETGIHVLAVAKWLERMGDHAENLAEQVIFLVHGRDIRHRGKLGGGSV